MLNTNDGSYIYYYSNIKGKIFFSIIFYWIIIIETKKLKK